MSEPAEWIHYLLGSMEREGMDSVMMDDGAVVCGIGRECFWVPKEFLVRFFPLARKKLVRSRW